MARHHNEHDFVRFLADSGRWPAGTTGTVVHSTEAIALVEIADGQGRGIDFVSLPHEKLAHESEHASHRALALIHRWGRRVPSGPE